MIKYHTFYILHPQQILFRKCSIRCKYRIHSKYSKQRTGYTGYTANPTVYIANTVQNIHNRKYWTMHGTIYSLHSEHCIENEAYTAKPIQYTRAYTAPQQTYSTVYTSYAAHCIRQIYRKMPRNFNSWHINKFS